MRAQRFLQDFLGLRVAPVGDVHVGFGDRIDFIRIELAGRWREARIEDAVVGVDALAAAFGEQRLGAGARCAQHRRFGRHGLYGRSIALAALRDAEQDQEQHQEGCSDIQHIVQQRVDQAFFWFRRRHRLFQAWMRDRLGRRRHDGRCCGGLLGFGACAARHRHQVFQFADVLFEFLDAGLGLFEFALLGQRVFDAGGAGLRRAGGACRGLRQAQLVLRFVGGGRLFFDARGHAPGCALAALRRAGRGAGGHLAGELVAVGVEVRRMRHDHAARFALARAATQRVAIGHAQDLARLQAVHVIADEGLGIGAVQRHEHHVERNLGRLHAGGDATERIAATHAVSALGSCGVALRRLALGAFACGGDASPLGRVGGRCSSSGSSRCCNGRLRRCTRRRGAGHLRRLRRAQFGRIEQERVLAHQTPVIPGQLEQHVDERLVQRLAGIDPDDLAATALLDGETQRQQRRIEVDVCTAEGFGRGQLDGHAGRILTGAGRQFDLGAQWLAKCRQHGQFSKPGRAGGGSDEHCTGNRRSEGFQRRCHELRLFRKMHSEQRVSWPRERRFPGVST